MRYLLSIIFGVFLLTITPQIFADSGGHDNLPKPDEVVQIILEKQKIKSVDDINLSKVSDKTLELLGDSVMQVMAGSTEAHDWMDRMHGGEGSAALKNFHIWLGRNYLSGDGNYYGGMGMMGPMMRGGAWGMPYGNIEGNYSGNYKNYPYNNNNSQIWRNNNYNGMYGGMGMMMPMMGGMMGGFSPQYSNDYQGLNQNWGTMPYSGYSHMGTGYGFFMIFFWTIIIIALVFLIKKFTQKKMKN